MISSTYIYIYIYLDEIYNILSYSPRVVCCWGPSDGMCLSYPGSSLYVQSYFMLALNVNMYQPCPYAPSMRCNRHLGVCCKVNVGNYPSMGHMGYHPFTTYPRKWEEAKHWALQGEKAQAGSMDFGADDTLSKQRWSPWCCYLWDLLDGWETLSSSLAPHFMMNIW